MVLRRLEIVLRLRVYVEGEGLGLAPTAHGGALRGLGVVELCFLLAFWSMHFCFACGDEMTEDSGRGL